MNHATRSVGDGSLVDGRVICVRPEKVLDIVGTNNGADAFMLIFESATEPAEGSVPKFNFPVKAGLGWTFGQKVDMTACYACYSSTLATKTKTADNRGSITGILKG